MTGIKDLVRPLPGVRKLSLMRQRLGFAWLGRLLGPQVRAGRYERRGIVRKPWPGQGRLP